MLTLSGLRAPVMALDDMLPQPGRSNRIGLDHRTVFGGLGGTEIAPISDSNVSGDAAKCCGIAVVTFYRS